MDCLSRLSDGELCSSNTHDNDFCRFAGRTAQNTELCTSCLIHMNNHNKTFIEATGLAQQK